MGLAYFRHEGRSLSLLNSSGSTIPAGTIADLGDGLVGVAINDIEDGTWGGWTIKGVLEFDKDAATDVMTVGQLVTIDTTAGNVTAVAGNHSVRQASGNGDATVWVEINVLETNA